MLKYGETEINSWTKFELTEDMTLNKFIELYEQQFKTSLSMVLHGTSIIYANFMPSSNGGDLISKILKEKYDLDVFSDVTELIIASDEDDLELPVIQVKMNKSNYISI